MRWENFLGRKRSNGFAVSLFHSAMIISLMIVLIVSVVLTSSCSGLTIIDDNSTKGEEDSSKIDGESDIDDGSEQGVLFVSFTKEHNGVSKLEGSCDSNIEGSCGNDLRVACSYSREMPDSNSFILSIKEVGGESVYRGLYGQRPDTVRLSAGTYDVEVCSREFAAPEFDAPCYYDSGTVLVESGRTTSISFLCKQSNCGLRLGFTSEFKKRFANYIAEVEDSKGRALYSYAESRFLYLTPGDIFIRLKMVDNSSSNAGNNSSGNAGNNSSDGGNFGGSSFLIIRKAIAAMEMVTVNLHSSTTGGGDSGGDNPSDDSQVFTGILIDTSSVWLSDDVVVGERRDGSTKELALTVDEISGYIGAKDVWVSGYVVGYLTQGSLISLQPFENETNIAIASVVGEKNRDLCAGVSLTAGSVRTALNLKSNPENLGKKVYIRGDVVESYFGLKGVKSVKECFIEK